MSEPVRRDFVRLPLPMRSLVERSDPDAPVVTTPPAPERGPRDANDVPTAAFYGQKARELREIAQLRYAVPKQLLDALGEANFRETIEDVRLALASLPVGTYALEQIAKTLADLKRKRVG